MANQHVLRHNQKWGVKGEGNEKYTSYFDHQIDAIEAAKQIAENQGGDVIVHNRNNAIRERNTYGKPDRFPPRG